jgi:hypothetical protein
MKQFLSIAILLLFTSISAFSQILENAFIIEDKAQKAQTIIEGKIISKHSYFTEGNKSILTDYEIEIYKVFKGNITGETITITDFGGEVSNTSVNTPCHRSNLIVGQTAIYFCGASKWNESNATNQIFSLALPQIIFSKEDYNGAIDNRQNYGSREYVYTAIQKATNKEYEQVKLNQFEEQAENWVRSIQTNLQSRSGNELLEYNFRNFNVQFPFVEFDITVKANEPNLKFGETEIYLEYSPQIFGNNIVLNSNISIAKEALILSNDYSLTVNDYALDELKIEVDLATNPISIGTLSMSEQKLCHLVVNLANVTNSGVIQFEDVNMQGKSYHFDENTKTLDAFETILTGTDLNYVFTDFSFSPQVITAGTKSVLTITAAGGADFGNIKGNIKMRDANHSNLGNINTMHKIEDQFVTWTPNIITVILPSISSASVIALTPGSGPIQIEKVDAGGNITTTFTSSSQINVFYAVTNADAGSSSTRDAVINLTELDTTGGVTFYLGEVLDSIPNTREIIEASLCLWKEKTGVNFNLSDSIITNPTANALDGLNVIYMVNDVPPFSMETVVSKQTTSLPPSIPPGGRYSWVTDIDIKVARYTNLSPLTLKNWNYTNNPPAANEIDFYAAIIHEFGHSHSLSHVIGMSPDTLDGRLMFPILNIGENIARRNIDATAIAGGLFVLQHSTDTLTALAGVLGSTAPTPMTRILNFDCIVNSTNDIIENITQVKLYPNPFNNLINIEYELLQSSEVTLQVYDITGKEIQRENLGFQTKGAYQRQLKFSLPKGIYFVKVQTDYGFKTLKVIKH